MLISLETLSIMDLTFERPFSMSNLTTTNSIIPINASIAYYTLTIIYGACASEATVL